MSAIQLRFKLAQSVMHPGHNIGVITAVDARRVAPYRVHFDSGWTNWYEDWEISPVSFLSFFRQDNEPLAQVEETDHPD